MSVNDHVLEYWLPTWKIPSAKMRRMGMASCTLRGIRNFSRSIFCAFDRVLIKQGIVTAVGVFIDFAVSYARKAPGTGQPLAETTDAGEHIDEFNQAPGSLWTWVLFWAYLIGTPHQKQKQPIIGCTKQNFFTVHNV